MADADRREVVWSRPARRDLTAIWQYLLTEAGPDLAEAQLRAIKARSEARAVRPHLGRPRDDIRQGLRGLLAAPYIIFYRVRLHEVQIVRVVHGSRGIPAAMAEDGD